MIETYGQKYRITWTSFHKGRELGHGEVTVRPTKPRVWRDVVMNIRSQAMNAADKWLKRNKPEYKRGDAWFLHIEPIEEDE